MDSLFYHCFISSDFTTFANLKTKSMANRHEYEIAFVGLKPGKHEYVYEIDDKFFAEQQPQDFTDAHVTVKLILDKQPLFSCLNLR